MTKQFSQATLDKIPAKTTIFLTAIGAYPIIRTIMANAGMGDEDIVEGRYFLNECLPNPKDVEKNRDTHSAKAQRSAVAELDQIDEVLFARIKGPLKRYYPGAYEYLFHKLKASRGRKAVLGVATILSRLDLLENGTDPSREAHREDDRAAVELLAKRGIDADERRRLQELVDVAFGPTEVLSEIPQADPEVLRANMTTLKEWYDDWATTAKAVIKKRHYLIRLGLAKPKVKKESEESVEDK